MNETPVWDPQPPDPETEWAVLFVLLFILIIVCLFIVYCFATGSLA